MAKKLTYEELEQRIKELERSESEWRKSEKALNDSEKRYQAITQTGTAGFWLTRIDGSFLEVNEAYAQMSGYSVEELLGMKISDVEASECPEEVAQHIGNGIETGSDGFETVHRRKDGSTFEVDVCFRYLPMEGGQFVVFLDDITERKQVGRLLCDSEARMRTLLEESPVCTKVIGLDSVLRSMSAAGLKAIDADPDTVIGQHYPPSFYPASTQKLLTENLERAKRGEITDLEAPSHDTRGNEVWFHTTFIPVRSEEGEIEYVIGVSIDTTERRQAEDRLHFQGNLLDVVEQAVIATDINGLITYWNPFAEKLYGWTPAEAIGRDVTEFIVPLDSHGSAAEVMGHLREGKSRSGDFLVQNRDGTAFPVLVTDTPFWARMVNWLV